MTAATAEPQQDNDAALNWARGHFPFVKSEVLTDRPWAKMVRLESGGKAAFLKILPELPQAILPDGPRTGVDLLTRISQRFPQATPQVLAADAEAGLILYDDHGGEEVSRRFPPETAAQILTAYAALQIEAADDARLLQAAPERRGADQIDRLMAFMSGKGLPEGSVATEFFLGRSAAGRYHAILASVRDRFSAFLAAADSLPATLNHCDLRGPNIARRPDGSLVFFDWDDAVAGPPGLSLHNFFSGCYRPWRALGASATPDPKVAAQDRSLLTAYCQGLEHSTAFKTAEFAAALPAAICAGVMNFLVSYSAYSTYRDSMKRTVARVVRRRMSDLMDLAGDLVQGPAERKRLAEAFVAAGRKERAATLGATPKMRRARARPAPAALPALELTDSERRRQKLRSATRDRGAALFNEHGVLLIKNAIAPDLVARCRDDFMQRYDRYFTEKKHPDALRIGDKRYMVSVTVEPPFNDADLLAAPLVFPIIRQVLGRKLILGSLTCVASLPGAGVQRLHKDHPVLFKDQPELELPSFAVTLIIPFIDLDEVTGSTHLIAGSHRVPSDIAKKMPGLAPEVPVGSCFLMDYRLTHQGMANRSDVVRPIFSIIYQQPWFRDYVNYSKQKPLIVAPGALDDAIPALRKIVKWAEYE